MSLTRYRTLGRSGLVVSPLALGTMTFGTGRWGTDRASSRAVFDAYRESGGNFIDTADVYGGGESERMLGEFIADTGSRDEIVLATKFGFHSGAKGNPNGGGAGAKNIHRALDASLKRLGTDFIDLYWMHVWDGVTPVEELVQTLGNLVRSGKIRYYGLSDMPAWLGMKAATLASERHVPGPVALQLEYSLVARDVENEYFPAAKEGGMSIVPWSPLAGGLLSGKYRRQGAEQVGRLKGSNPFGNSKFTEHHWAVVEVLQSVAQEVGRPAAQVALAWTLAQPNVASTLVGASSADQLRSNLEASSLKLTGAQMQRLDRSTELEPGVGMALTQPNIRRMVFGGNDVTGWDVPVDVAM
jgi:aryl-alcohol dehydrogenase-like predicted oxidoreductase